MVSVHRLVAVVQSLSRVRLFATLWTAARQASLSLTISQSLPKFMSIESVMLSDHPTLCCPLLLLPSTLPTGPLVSCTFIPFLGGSRGDLRSGEPPSTQCPLRPPGQTCGVPGSEGGVLAATSSRSRTFRHSAPWALGGPLARAGRAAGSGFPGVATAVWSPCSLSALCSS